MKICKLIAIVFFLHQTLFGATLAEIQLMMQNENAAQEQAAYLNSQEYKDSLPPTTTLSPQGAVENDLGAYLTAQEAINSIDTSTVSAGTYSGQPGSIAVAQGDGGIGVLTPQVVTQEQLDEAIEESSIYGHPITTSISTTVGDSAPEVDYGLENNILANDTYINMDTSTYVDRDNDVPTLIMIWRRQAEIFAKEKDQRGKLISVVQGLQAEVQASRGTITIPSLEENGTEYERNATLADIVEAIKGIDGYNPDNDRNLTQEKEIFDSNLTVATTNNDIQEIIDNVEDDFKGDVDLGSFVEKSDTSIMIEWDFLGQGTDSFNLADISQYTGINVPSLSDVFGFIKTFLTVAIFCLYLFAVKNMAIQAFQNLIKSVESNPVTNYSVFGNSIPAVAVKAAKTIIVGAILANIYLTLLVAQNDAGIMDSVGSGALSGLINDLITGYGFMSESLSWATLIIPFATISMCVSTYWMNKFAIYTAMFMMSRGARVIS